MTNIDNLYVGKMKHLTVKWKHPAKKHIFNGEKPICGSIFNTNSFIEWTSSNLEEANCGCCQKSLEALDKISWNKRTQRKQHKKKYGARPKKQSPR